MHANDLMAEGPPSPPLDGPALPAAGSRNASGGPATPEAAAGLAPSDRDDRNDHAGDRPAYLRTKIIATLGPASADPACVRRLVEEGVRIFRINFSHGTFDAFEDMVRTVREVESQVRVDGEANIGILGDLCGPKIRLGPVPGPTDRVPPGDDGTLMLAVGDLLRLVDVPPGDGAGDFRATLTTTHPPLVHEVRVGDRLLVDDGAVRMLVVDRLETDTGAALVCRVTTAGPIQRGKGINLPDTPLNVAAITEHDWRCVRWAVKHDVDLLALSFVRSASEVRQLQQALVTMGRRIPVIAKIEKPQALADLDRIVETADGVMVARGDLGVEMDVTEVPLIQKRIVAVARERGRPVVVATQMLQSMISSPRN